MEEFVLGGDGDQDAGGDQDDGLAHLLIPAAEGETFTFKSSDFEVGAAQIVVEGLGIGAVGAGDGLAQASESEPGGVVLFGHPAPGFVLETPLHLGRSPLLVGAMPGCRFQAVGPGDQVGVPRPVGEIFAEHVAFIGDHDDVVLLGVLGEDRELPLDLDMAAVGASCGRFIFVSSDIDDLRPELAGGALQGGLEGEVGLRRAVDQHPCPPALPDQILGQRIRFHRSAGYDVEQIGAAFFCAKEIALGADIEEERAFGFGEVGDGQKLAGIGTIDNEDAAAGGQGLLRGGDQVAVDRHGDIGQLIIVPEESAGGLVVGLPEPGAGEPVIRDLQRIEQGERRQTVDLLRKIGDLDLELFLGED